MTPDHFERGLGCLADLVEREEGGTGAAVVGPGVQQARRGTEAWFETFESDDGLVLCRVDRWRRGEEPGLGEPVRIDL